MGLTAEMREALAARVRFYRELGIGELYRRPVAASLTAALDIAPLQVEIEEEVISPRKSRVSLHNSGSQLVSIRRFERRRIRLRRLRRFAKRLAIARGARCTRGATRLCLPTGARMRG